MRERPSPRRRCSAFLDSLCYTDGRNRPRVCTLAQMTLGPGRGQAGTEYSIFDERLRFRIINSTDEEAGRERSTTTSPSHHLFPTPGASMLPAMKHCSGRLVRVSSLATSDITKKTFLQQHLRSRPLFHVDGVHSETSLHKAVQDLCQLADGCDLTVLASATIRHECRAGMPTGVSTLNHPCNSRSSYR